MSQVLIYTVARRYIGLGASECTTLVAQQWNVGVKTSVGGVETIHAAFSIIDDNVGTMQMNGKIYLAFDELMLYIGTTRKALQEYGIERTRSIE